MEWLEDALNKLWEQSICYYESINFTLADVGQEDAGFYFCTAGCETQTNEENDSWWCDWRLGKNCDMTVVMSQFVSKMCFKKKSTVLLSSECDLLIYGWTSTLAGCYCEKLTRITETLKIFGHFVCVALQNTQCYYKHYNYVHAIRENRQNPGK